MMSLLSYCFNRFLHLFIVTLLLVSYQPSLQICTVRGEYNESINKFYNGSAIDLDANGVAIFEELCSFMLPVGYKHGDPIPTCCDTAQLTTFQESISQATTILSSCPICKENIQRLTCSLICSVNQADFATAKVVADNPNLVETLNVNISYKFADGLFNSCKDVLIPNSLIPVLSTMCHGEVTCDSGEKLIKSLLSFSLFEINPSFGNVRNDSEHGVVAYSDPEYVLCNTSYKLYNKLIKACGCQDCAMSCNNKTIYVPPQRPLIWGVFTLYQVILLFLGAFILITYIVVVICCMLKNPSEHISYDISDDNDKANLTEDGDRDEGQTSVPDMRGGAFGARVHKKIRKLLNRWGKMVCSNKIIFIVFPLIFITTLSCGVFYHFEVTSDPIDIWSPPNGEYRKQKDFYDENFGPFYRTEQIIIKTPKLKSTEFNFNNKNYSLGPPINKTIISQLFYLQKEIEKLNASYFDPNKNQNLFVTLDDICFKPLEPMNGNCTFFSLTQYFQNSVKNFNLTDNEYDWRTHIIYCMNNPSSITDGLLDGLPCLSEFMAPVHAKLVFGGYNASPIEADSLVITYVINNHIDKKDNHAAEAWEAALIELLKKYSNPDIVLSFMTERSVQDELDRQSHAEIKTVSISYFIMFLYVTLALGKFRTGSFKNFLIEQKIVLGFVGVLLVLFSVLASIGLFCFFKCKINMIVLEVLPFLTLAIGVDNIFLMVHEFQRLRKGIVTGDVDIQKLIGKTMANVGHGMVVSAIAQVSTFSIGAISNIPAVRSFSLFAAVALGINFLMQVTCFLAIFTFDFIREKERRPNIFCCFKMDSEESAISESLMESFFGMLAKVTLSNFMRPLIVFVFLFCWLLSLFYIPSIPIGLDQKVALPQDSYLVDYFDNMMRELRSGPPVYFMLTPGYHYETTENQYKICSGIDCSPVSLSSTIYSSSKVSNYSKIATPLDSWLDTYLAWLRTSSSDSPCCSYRVDPTTSQKVFCPSYLTRPSDCRSCFKTGPTEEVVPTKEEFFHYLPWFLDDIPVKQCPLGGKPSYKRSVVLNKDYYDKNMTVDPILATSFMAYHSALSSSLDMIDAMRMSREISNNVSIDLGHNVIPYSVFYIYYESYFTIWKEASISFGISFVAVFTVNLLLFGFELRMSIMMTFLTFIMNAMNAGCMFILGINLNPVSLVNLIMFIGINVEFLSHIGRAYLTSGKLSRIENARIALTQTGSSVFSGIALTKILGIVVLAFSKSLLFQVYYFQMYSCAIIIGTLHGLILLPVLLSYFGPIIQQREAPSVNSPYSPASE